MSAFARRARPPGLVYRTVPRHISKMILNHSAKARPGSNPEKAIPRIGNTPIVRIRRLNPYEMKIYAKLEYRNPFGSVKDRPAYWMIKEAMKRGELKKGDKIIIEPTSGNTGIALANIATRLGFGAEIVMPEVVSEETKRVLYQTPARIHETWNGLCPSVGKGTDQSIALARSIAKSYPSKYFMPNQYENLDNVKAHYETTGPEIWRQTSGAVSHFIAGIGTGGTVVGVGKFLKERNPEIKIYAVEPVPGHHIQGLRNRKESSTPKILEKYLHLIDEWVSVSDKEAFETAQELFEQEELPVGPSSGAAMYGALSIARGVGRGLCVTIFPDGRERHTSSFLNYPAQERTSFQAFTRKNANLLGSNS